MSANAPNIDGASSGSARQSRPPKVTCTTRWPAPRQSNAAQPPNPLGRSRSWIEQRKSALRFGQGCPAGLSIANSAEAENADPTQHSAAQRAQSARNSARRRITAGAADSLPGRAPGPLFIAFNGPLVITVAD